MDLARDIEDTAREVQRRVRPRLREVQKRADDLNQDLTRYIKENPIKSLLGAVGLGILIGKLARR